MPDRALSILADDLTGAADSAVAFASRGISSCVIWNCDEIARLRRVPVLAFDTETRRLSASQAAKRNVALLEQCVNRGSLLFKKIDSTLRGQPAAEIAGIWNYLRKRSGKVLGILAPASPLTGTATLNGYVHRNGLRLDFLSSWKTDLISRTANLTELLSAANINATSIPLETVRSGGGSLRAALEGVGEKGDTLAICDAVEQADLDQIARASLSAKNYVLFIGSGGLAKSVACAFSNQETTNEVPCFAYPSRGALIVVGSVADESQKSASHLLRKRGLRDFEFKMPTQNASRFLADLLDGLAREVITGLRSGDDILVRTAIPKNCTTLDPRVVAGLAKGLAPAASHASAIVATGGETAFALLNRIGARKIQLIRELEPGVAVGIATGGINIPVVTKAGGFGGESTLSDIVDHLRSIRNRGAP